MYRILQLSFRKPQNTKLLHLTVIEYFSKLIYVYLSIFHLFSKFYVELKKSVKDNEKN